jgi:uncharacterized protein YraI
MKWQLKRHHEHMLIATLVGLVIVGAAGVAVTPTQAAGSTIETTARVSGVAWWDTLDVRKWPAFYSRRVGALSPETSVSVERCIPVQQAADWCKVENGTISGWVNSRFLKLSASKTYGDL